MIARFISSRSGQGPSVRHCLTMVRLGRRCGICGLFPLTRVRRHRLADRVVRNGRALALVDRPRERRIARDGNQAQGRRGHHGLEEGGADPAFLAACERSKSACLPMTGLLPLRFGIAPTGSCHGRNSAMRLDSRRRHDAVAPRDQGPLETNDNPEIGGKMRTGAFSDSGQKMI